MRVAYKKKTGYSISDKVDNDIQQRILNLKKQRADLEGEQRGIIDSHIDRGDRLVDPLVVPNFQSPEKPYIKEPSKKDAKAILNSALMAVQEHALGNLRDIEVRDFEVPKTVAEIEGAYKLVA